MGGNYCACKCIYVQIYVAKAADWLIVGLLQKQSLLAFNIWLQGSPLATLISQACPQAPKHGEREDGEMKRTNGDTEMMESDSKGLTDDSTDLYLCLFKGGNICCTVLLENWTKITQNIYIWGYPAYCENTSFLVMCLWKRRKQILACIFLVSVRLF